METIDTLEDLNNILDKLMRKRSKMDSYIFLITNYKLEYNVLRDFAYRILQDNIPHVIWITLSNKQNLSEDFIREFRYNIYYPSLLENKNLSDELIDRISDIINWEEVVSVYNYYKDNRDEYLFPRIKYYLERYNII